LLGAGIGGQCNYLVKNGGKVAITTKWTMRWSRTWKCAKWMGWGAHMVLRKDSLNDLSISTHFHSASHELNFFSLKLSGYLFECNTFYWNGSLIQWTSDSIGRGTAFGRIWSIDTLYLE
jgi:hypothetical protein